MRYDISEMSLSLDACSAVLVPRQMTLAEVPEVALLESEVSLSPWSQEIFRDCLQASHHCSVIRSDRLIGYAVMSVAAEEAHLLNIAIAPQEQGKGHGGRLLRFLLQVAAEEGARRIFLEVRPSNGRAQDMYRQHGFELLHVRRDYYGNPFREDALVLALDLIQSDRYPNVRPS